MKNKTFFTTNIFTGAGFVLGAFDRSFTSTFVSNGNYYITNITVFAWLSTASSTTPVTTMQRTLVTLNKNTANFNSGATTNSFFSIMPAIGYITFPFYNLITARETISLNFQMYINSAAVAGDVANGSYSINYYSIM